MANIKELFVNNASSTLAGSISNVAAALNLASGTGALFPSPNNAIGEFFRLSLTDLATGLLHEIVYVTSRTGDTCTIVRGQEGTVAQSWQAGDLAANQNTAGAMQNMVQASQAQAGAFSYDATDTGVANAYAIQLTPIMPTGIDGAIVRFKAANANTGASTLTIDSGTSYPLVGLNGTALQGGEIVANGIVVALFNSSLGGGSYVVLNATSGATQVKTAVASNQAVQFGQVSGLVGATRNGRMTVLTAAATGTYAADEVIVETALGGLRYCLANYSQAINLGTTGAGGMDTGTAPLNGFVALYAAYNPTANTRTIFAQNVSGTPSEVYSGANAPAGFTATALVGIVRTNGSGQFIVHAIQDREVSFAPISVLSLTTTSATYASIALGAAIPPSAKAVNTSASIINTTAGVTAELDLASDANSAIAVIVCDGNLPAANTGRSSNGWLPVLTSQTIYGRRVSGGGTTTFGAGVTGYRF